MNQIALLGTGAMGCRIADAWLSAGYDLIVYNRTPEKVSPLLDRGAQQAKTPKHAAEQADIVISMVTDDEASRSIWLEPNVGAATGLRKGAIVIESSTLTVHWTRQLATALEHRGARFLDAPVVGSRPQAEAKKMIYLVGGQAETLKVVHPILSAVSAAIHHLGSVGQGMLMKLAVNALFGAQIAAMGEIVGLLLSHGLSVEQSLDCLKQLPIMSPAVGGASQLMVTGNHAPLFPIELVEKDFRYAIQSGQEVHADLPISTMVHQTYQRAIAAGYGNSNITGIVQLFT
ncbi:MAG: NAD(P)-dependent oxidoreductase [Cyanobacteria bacterium J06627_8]